MESEEPETETTEDLLVEFCHNKEQSNGGRGSQGKSRGIRKGSSDVIALSIKPLILWLYKLMD